MLNACKKISGSWRFGKRSGRCSFISAVTTKANRTLGFLKRNLQVKSEPLKTTAYKSLVRPLVEYAPSVWDPHTEGCTKQIEMVQRRAARYVNMSSVTDMLKHLEWESLEERRKNQRLSMMYKIHHGLVAIDASQYTQRLPARSRAPNQLQYAVPPSNTVYHLNTFFPRTVREWNSLPNQIVSAPTLSCFKSRLAKQAPVVASGWRDKRDTDACRMLHLHRDFSHAGMTRHHIQHTAPVLTAPCFYYYCIIIHVCLHTNLQQSRHYWRSCKKKKTPQIRSVKITKPGQRSKLAHITVLWGYRWVHKIPIHTKSDKMTLTYIFNFWP